RPPFQVCGSVHARAVAADIDEIGMQDRVVRFDVVADEVLDEQCVERAQIADRCGRSKVAEGGFVDHCLYPVRGRRSMPGSRSSDLGKIAGHALSSRNFSLSGLASVRSTSLNFAAVCL